MSAPGSSAPSTEGEPSLFATLREAVRGTEQDLTAIPLRRAVLLLSVPMVLEMSMESLLVVVDIFFVAKLGSSAVATVGLTESMLSLVYAIAMGLSSGATAIIARKTGEKDQAGAAVAAVQVMLCALVGSLVFGAIGAAGAKTFLGLMGAAPEVVSYGHAYTSVMFAGSATIFSLFVINAVFRASGDASTAMRALWISNITNMLLCPVLVFGLGPFPRMGVVGAAVATTFSRALGVGYQLVMLRRGSSRMALRREHFRVDREVLSETLRVSSTAALQVLVETASWLGLTRILATFGSAALAGYTIAMRVAIFAMLPAWGLASAAATLVGQNLGAKEPGRAKESVRTVARYNVAFLGSVGVALVALPAFFVQYFTKDPAVLALGADCLRIAALGFPCFAYGMVSIQAFNGAGDTLTPMALNAVCFWLCKIPLAYLLGVRLGLGPRGVFFAIMGAYTAQAVGGFVLFKSGRWLKASPEKLAPAAG